MIVGDIFDTFNTSTETVNTVVYDAFSFGTVSCNIGNVDVMWNAFPSVCHPAIAQGLYKLKTVNGNLRIEEIGISWLKHGFTALQDNTCGCGCNGHGGSVLGIGCADPYTGARNAGQSSLKPRWYVNAHTGVYPSTQNTAGGSGTTYRRLRVKLSDLEASNNDVRYFVECQYVTQDDAYYNNEYNNTSYREVSMSGTTDMTASLIGGTQREKAGIRAWKDVDNLVQETMVQIPEAAPVSGGASCVSASAPLSANTSSLVIISSRANYLGNYTWHYEYAVQNVNADTSIGSFTVPLPPGAVLTNIGFHDVDYHSGDGLNNVNYSSTDWTTTRSSGAILWTTPQSFATDPNGNAIRWGTMYNFRFDCNLPPSRTILGGRDTQAILGTFKSVGSYNGLVVAPDTDCNNNGIGDGIELFQGTLHDTNGNGIPDECEGNPCPGDISHNGAVNVDDLLMVINSWGACPSPCPPSCAADVNGNCFVNVDDLLVVINSWGPCP